MTELPKTLEEAIVQAQTATQAAIDNGLTRIQIELVYPELKVMPVAQQFIPAFADLGEQLRVFFPDPGAAALARRDWGETPYPVRGIGELKAQILPQERLFLFVEPSSVEVNQVDELCQEAQDLPVILLNPRLEDVAIVGIGYAARQIRERFLSRFEACYYLRPLENAVLIRCYPQPWQVWLEADGTHRLIAEEPQKPVGEALEQILARATGDEKPAAAPQKGFLSGLQQFIRALSQ